MEYDSLENTEFAGFSVGPLLRSEADGATYDAVGDGNRFRLKVLHPALSDSSNPAIARYLEDLVGAEATRHANLVNVESTGEHDGLRFAVLEFVEGPTLAEVLDGGGSLEIPVAVDLLSQLLRGLQVLHEAGMVHGCLGPDKIIQAPGGAWKIDGAGFPAWRLGGSGLGLPEDRFPAHYLSPEHVVGAEVEPRSDLYSAGAIAYELLTGRSLFAGLPEDTVRAFHLTETPEDPSTLRSDLPPALAGFVKRLLAKAPEDRFDRASQAEEALKELQSGTASNEGDEGAGEAEDRSGGFLASAFLGAEGEERDEDDDDAFRLDGLTKSPTEMMEGAFASLGDTIQKDKTRRRGPPPKPTEGEETENGWSFGPADGEEKATGETYDLSSSRAEPETEEPAPEPEPEPEPEPPEQEPEPEEPEEPEKPGLPVDGFQEEPDSEGEEEEEPEGPSRVVTTLSEHLKTKESPPNSVEEEEWVDLGPWAKKKKAEKKPGPKPEPESPAEEGRGLFAEFHKMREEVEKDVVTSIRRKQSPEEEVSGLLEKARQAWAIQNVELAGHAMVKALNLDATNSEAIALKREIDALMGEIEALRRRGEAAFDEGGLTEARDCYIEIMNRTPGNRDAKKRLGEIEEAIKKKKDRLKWMVLSGSAGVLVIVVGVLAVLLAVNAGKKPEPAPVPVPVPESKRPRQKSPPEQKGPGPAEKVEKPVVDEKEMKARLARALERRAEGDWKGAVDDLRALADVEIVAEETAGALGDIEAERGAEADRLREAGDSENAEKAYLELAAVFPEGGFDLKAREVRYAVLFAEGKRLFDLGMTDKAMDMLGKAASLDVKDDRAKKLLEQAGVSSWRAKAEQLESTGYWEGAKFYYEKILKVLENDPEIRAKAERMASLIEYDKAFKRLDDLFFKGDLEGAAKAAEVALASGVDDGTAKKAAALLDSLKGLVFVPAGPFTMGYDDGMSQEKPAWKAELPAFCIMLNEVTVAEYYEFLKSPAGRDRTPLGWEDQQKHPRRPITGITLEDAKAFAKSRGMEIPEETLWERAARGAGGRIWPWGAEFFQNLANTAEAGKEEAADVDEFKFDKSALGALNMGGNAAEWTTSPYRAYPGGAGDYPKGQVVIRGGDFESNSEYARGSARRGAPPDARKSTLGFRCVSVFRFRSLRELK